MPCLFSRPCMLLIASTTSLFSNCAVARPQDVNNAPLAFYKSIGNDPESKNSVDALRLSRELEVIEKQSPEDVAVELPYILATFKSADPDIRRLGALGVTIISTRADGASLLSSAIPNILAELQDPVPQVAALTLASIAWMRPAPPKTVVPPLIAFLGTDQARSQAGTAVVGTLLGIDPKNAEIVQAVLRFLDSTEGELAANTVRELRGEKLVDETLVTAVIKRTSRGYSQAIRFEAIQDIGSMDDAHIKNSPLRQIANDSEDDSVIRQEAKEILERRFGSANKH